MGFRIKLLKVPFFRLARTCSGHPWRDASASKWLSGLGAYTVYGFIDSVRNLKASLLLKPRAMDPRNKMLWG